ncbi:MAG TPA: 3'-5' exonuclease [Burkholderiales bacterium]|nr:3'-5' exonuclease [Burkholderiales bacterium]
MNVPAELQRTISRDEVVALPIQRYEGETVVVGSPAELERAREDFAQEALVGIDTETRPAFRKGESYPPSLVQVATAKAVYLFQIQQLDCSSVLKGLLDSESVVKAGVSLAYDLRQLKQVFPFDEKAVVDVGWAAKRQGFEQTGVRNLAALLLGLRIPKGAKTTNWSARQLSPQQIAYAATDAWVCRQLYLRFGELGLL